MDTATHFAFGFGLAGLAQIDPNVGADVWAQVAVTIGTVAGSQAPDADTLLRLRSNESYVRHHRGVSHSIPAWFVWTGLISSALWLAFPSVPFWTLATWVFVAVAVHVASDLFNTYGTQAFRPLSAKWIAWNVIHIFDPFLFGAHMAAILLWTAGFAEASVVFPTLYAGLVVYYAWRWAVHARVERELPKLDRGGRSGERYVAIPTVHWDHWNVLKTSEGRYDLGTLRQGRLEWSDSIRCESSPAIEKSREHPAVDAFLSFCPYPCPSEEKRNGRTVVRWVDARYQHRKQYPFLAVVEYDERLTPVFSYVGWISDQKLERKLREASSRPNFAGTGR